MDVTFHESQSYFQPSPSLESHLPGEQWYEEEVTLPVPVMERRGSNEGEIGADNERVKSNEVENDKEGIVDNEKEKSDEVANEGNRTPTRKGKELLVYSKGTDRKSTC